MYGINRAVIMGLMISALLTLSSPLAMAGDPGRLDANTGFLLGHWSNDCKAGSVKIFLKDGALRQQGLVQLLAPGSTTPIAPVTLLAATRDGTNIVLSAKTRQAGLLASSRYSGLLENQRHLRLKHMTVCRGERCRSASIDLPWQRCS